MLCIYEDFIYLATTELGDLSEVAPLQLRNNLSLRRRVPRILSV